MALSGSSAMAFVEVGADGIRAADCDRPRDAYRTALRHHLIERMLTEISAWSGTRFMRRPSGWSTPSRQPLKPNSRKKLGEGGACPHGNQVLPENPAERKKRGEIQLSDAVEGRRYTVISLHERDPKLLLFLHSNGIGPGQSLRVVSQNYDKTVSIELPAGIRSWAIRRRRRSGCGRKLDGN